MSDFGKEIAAAYATTGASIEVGKGVLDGKVVTEADVRLPLRSANRHGLIAGATGTGKTRTLVEVALFAWRYLFLLIEDAQVVYHAQKNRLGYSGYLRGIRSMGTLAGVLVLKAFDSSQSITTAMTQRGYNGEMPLLQHKPFVVAEVCFTLFFLVVMAALRIA